MYEDYLEDDCDLDRHTIEELQAWIKHLGLKLVDPNGETVPLNMVAYTAELANSTTALRMKVLEASRKPTNKEQKLEWGRTYTFREAAEITGQSTEHRFDAAEEAEKPMTTFKAEQAADIFGIQIKELEDD